MEKRELKNIANKGISFDFIKENCKTIGDLRRLVEVILLETYTLRGNRNEAN